MLPMLSTADGTKQNAAQNASVWPMGTALHPQGHTKVPTYSIMYYYVHPYTYYMYMITGVMMIYTGGRLASLRTWHKRRHALAPLAPTGSRPNRPADK